MRILQKMLAVPLENQMQYYCMYDVDFTFKPFFLFSSPLLWKITELYCIDCVFACNFAREYLLFYTPLLFIVQQ